MVAHLELPNKQPITVCNYCLEKCYKNQISLQQVQEAFKSGYPSHNPECGGGWKYFWNDLVVVVDDSQKIVITAYRPGYCR
jgi:hypothetical protein